MHIKQRNGEFIIICPVHARRDWLAFRVNRGRTSEIVAAAAGQHWRRQAPCAPRVENFYCCPTFQHMNWLQLSSLSLSPSPLCPLSGCCPPRWHAFGRDINKFRDVPAFCLTIAIHRQVLVLLRIVRRNSLSVAVVQASSERGAYGPPVTSRQTDRERDQRIIFYCHFMGHVQ